MRVCVNVCVCVCVYCVGLHHMTMGGTQVQLCCLERPDFAVTSLLVCPRVYVRRLAYALCLSVFGVTVCPCVCTERGCWFPT